MITISVIIPVYNVEAYLDECIGSIVEYKEKDIEIVLIDDGSTDNSGHICDRWGERDSRIRVVHKVNGGASDARNVGIETAKGKYYFFLDADDYISGKQGFSKIITYLREVRPQVLMVNWCKVYGKSVDKRSKFGIETDEFSEFTIEEVVSTGIYHASPCNKIIRAEILDENKIKFPVDRLAEDIEYCGELLDYLDYVSVYHKPIYQYRMRKGSRSKNISNKNLNDIYEMIVYGINGKENRLKKMFFSYEYAVLLGISKNADPDLIEKICSLEELLNYGKSKKVKAVNSVRKLLGIRVTRKILIIFVLLKSAWKI